MSCDAPIHLEATASELEAAEMHLASELDAPPDDEGATERIIAALNRLRQAQARHVAARAGLPHLPDLVGHGQAV